MTNVYCSLFCFHNPATSHLNPDMALFVFDPWRPCSRSFIFSPSSPAKQVIYKVAGTPAVPVQCSAVQPPHHSTPHLPATNGGLTLGLDIQLPQLDHFLSCRQPACRLPHSTGGLCWQMALVASVTWGGQTAGWQANPLVTDRSIPPSFLPRRADSATTAWSVRRCGQQAWVNNI